MPPAPKLVRLAAGPLGAELCPEIGGSLVRFTAWGLDVLRPVSDADLESREARRMGCYVLVPFSNRLRNACFVFEGEDFELAPNFPPEPHAIHGNGWQRAWRIEAETDTSVRLVLEHDPARDGADAWPFAYWAALDADVTAERLALRLSIENRDRRRMPAGLGLHPFFPLTPTTRLEARLAGVWLNDEGKLPSRHVPVPPGLEFRSAAPLSPLSVDNCFTGWTGAASIEWPDRGLGLALEASAALANLVVFVPQAHDYFCCEPVSNVNNGINLTEAGVPNTGVVALAPGEVLTAEVLFRPVRLSRA